MNPSPEPVRVIRDQISAARPDLERCRPDTVDWFARATATAESVMPWLCDIAADACGFCEEVYNAPERLRRAWGALKSETPLGAAGDRVDFLLAREQVLLNEIAGDVVSRVLTDYLKGDGGGRLLRANGHSDYPDLFLTDRSYSELPKHVRSKGRKGWNEDRWAALKGSPPRPVRVPDGLEIKTCRNSFRVDCHYGHMGLHVALFYTEQNGTARVHDLLAAFLRPGDYSVSRINTGATTTKHSFGPARFVSLLPGGRQVGQVLGFNAKAGPPVGTA